MNANHLGKEGSGLILWKPSIYPKCANKVSEDLVKSESLGPMHLGQNIKANCSTKTPYQHHQQPSLASEGVNDGMVNRNNALK